MHDDELPLQLPAHAPDPHPACTGVVTFWQLPDAVHAWHGPVQVLELQQKPSAQMLEKHSLAPPHDAPLALRMLTVMVPLPA